VRLWISPPRADWPLGQIRRPEPLRRDAGDDQLEKVSCGPELSIVQEGIRRYSSRGLLSWLVRIAHPPRQARRSGDTGIKDAGEGRRRLRVNRDD